MTSVYNTVFALGVIVITAAMLINFLIFVAISSYINIKGLLLIFKSDTVLEGEPFTVKNMGVPYNLQQINEKGLSLMRLKRLCLSITILTFFIGTVWVAVFTIFGVLFFNSTSS